MKFRKKPVVIEAFQWKGEVAIPSWCVDRAKLIERYDSETGDVRPVVLQIETLEGSMFASRGDWVIRGVKGEVYPCRADIFAETYEAAE